MIVRKKPTKTSKMKVVGYVIAKKRGSSNKKRSLRSVALRRFGRNSAEYKFYKNR